VTKGLYHSQANELIEKISANCQKNTEESELKQAIETLTWVYLSTVAQWLMTLAHQLSYQ